MSQSTSRFASTEEDEEEREGSVHWHLAQMYFTGELGHKVGGEEEDRQDDPYDTDLPMSDQRRSSILYYLSQAAEAGDRQACYALGRLHDGLESDEFPNLILDDDDGERDPRLAGRFYVTAAKANMLEACVRVAKAHQVGALGLDLDAGLSLKYWRDANDLMKARDSRGEVKEWGATERYIALAAMANLYSSGGAGLTKSAIRSYELYNSSAEVAFGCHQNRAGREYLALAEEVGMLIEEEEVMEEEEVVVVVVEEEEQREKRENKENKEEEEVVVVVMEEVEEKKEETEKKKKKVMLTEEGKRLLLLSERWKSNLWGEEGVVNFWMTHSLDSENGGYYTCLNHDGMIYDRTKYSWLQGRQVYMLSNLYNEYGGGEEVGEGREREERERRMSWLIAAGRGANFLDVALDKDNTNLLFFSTTENGKHLLHLQRKPYSAVFYVQGMLEYYRALRHYEQEEASTTSIPPPPTGTLLQEHLENKQHFYTCAVNMFERLLIWISDPSTCGRPITTLPPSSLGTTSLADVMCAASLSLHFLLVLDEETRPMDDPDRCRYLQLVRDAIDNCARHHDQRQGRNVFLETVSGDGINSNTPSRRLFCPGHSIEVAWFLLKMCDVVGGSEIHEEMALSVLEGSLNLGWDEDYGGLL